MDTQAHLDKDSAFPDVLSNLISKLVKPEHVRLYYGLTETYMLLQQRIAEHHDIKSTTGKRPQTRGDKVKYLFRVLLGELRLSLESGAEDTLQDKRIK